MTDLTKKRGSAFLSIVGSVAGGLALLIASQFYIGIGKAQDTANTAITEISGIKKDITYIKCAVKVQSDINNKKKDVTTICGE